MGRILCFGELLLRLSPQLEGEWIRQHSMPVFLGGAELNVATALSHWKLPVSYCTALPDHYLSREIVAAIEEKGIGAKEILLSGHRIGTYYLPQGSDLKNAGVIYDRAHSAFWELKPGRIDWDRVLSGAGWFHFSAISPALNADLASVCREGAEAASRKGITVSIDLNHRPKLWQYGKAPREVIPQLVEYCDLVMGNIWSADALLGINVDAGIHDRKSKAAYLEHAAKTAGAIMKDFSRVRSVAHTFRFDEGEGVRHYATLGEKRGQFVSDEFSTTAVVDRVGSGDAFMAGLIYGNYQQLAPGEIINFAAAAAFNKLFIKGDASTASVEEIKKRHLNYA
jgi:2-dehydro-3-deoxygluconokinase